MAGGAAAVGARRNCIVTTRSPTLRSVTPAPSAAITPDGSTPSTCGMAGGTTYLPARTTRSRVRFTETAFTLTSTSPGAGTGVGTSSSRMTSGGPNSRSRTAFTGSGHRVRDELLRRRTAPLRGQALFGAQQVGRVVDVQHIGIGPVLVHAAPGILPVVVDLAAQQVPADAPDMLVLAGALQMLVAHHQVIEAVHLERHVVQPAVRAFEAQEGMVIDVGLAAVAAVERGDDVVLMARVHLVGGHEAEHLAVPADLLPGALRHEHRVRDALHLRRPGIEAQQLAGAPQLLVAPVGDLLAQRDGLHGALAADQLHLVAERIGDAHAPAGARLVDALDAARAARLRKPPEVFLALHVEPHAEQPGGTQVRDMNVRCGIGAAHVQPVPGSLGARHAEMREELLGLIEARRLKPDVGEVRDLDYWHAVLLLQPQRIAAR